MKKTNSNYCNFYSNFLQKRKCESAVYKINNIDYITKTDNSVNIKVVNKDTLKFYYLKDKLRCVIINDFVKPVKLHEWEEYITVKHVQKSEQG